MMSLVETVKRMYEKMIRGGVRIYHGTSYCSIPQLTVQEVSMGRRTINARLK